jgi:hypothetical protein
MGEAPFRKSVFIVDRQRTELSEHLRAHFAAERRGEPPDSWTSMSFIFLPGIREVEGMPPRR